MHLHEYYELEIVLSGCGEQDLNGSRYPLEPGTVYFLTPIDFHAIHPRQKMEIVNLSFDESLLTPQLRLLFMNRRENYFFPESTQVAQSIQRLLECLMEELQRHDRCSQQCRSDLLELILLNLVRAAEAAPGWELFDMSDQLRRSLQYLFCHFREDITLAQVAQESGYTPNYFSKRFHDLTGERFVDFLARLRLNYARMLLLSTDLSVTRIAEKSGFGSVASFHRRFQDSYNIAPTALRKEAPLPPIY